MVSEFSLSTTEFDELKSAAYLGLVEAAERFEEGHGSGFKHFAFIRIRGSVIDSIRRNCSLSPALYRRLKAVEAAHNLRQDCSFDNLESKEEKIGRLVEYLGDCSLVFKMSLDDTHVPQIASTTLNPEDTAIEEDNRKILLKFIDELPEYERIVVKQYYYDDKQFIEILNDLGIHTKSWLSRVHARAIRRLRERIQQSGVVFA